MCVCVCIYTHVYIYVLIAHPQTRRSEEFKKCDVSIGHILKRMLLLSIVEKLVAGSCTEC